MGNEPPCWIGLKGKIIDLTRCWPLVCTVTCTRHGYPEWIAYLKDGKRIESK